MDVTYEGGLHHSAELGKHNIVHSYQNHFYSRQQARLLFVWTLLPHPSKLLAANTTLRNVWRKSSHGVAFLAYSVITSRDAQNSWWTALHNSAHSPFLLVKILSIFKWHFVLAGFPSLPLQYSLLSYCVSLQFSPIPLFVATAVPPLPAECKHFESSNRSFFCIPSPDCLHPAGAYPIFFELEGLRSLCLVKLLQRVCWAAPWNVFRNPEAKNISPKQPQWLPCREQDLADEAEDLCPPGGVPPSNLQMPFLEERSLFSPCKCLLGLVPHWQ